MSCVKNIWEGFLGFLAVALLYIIIASVINYGSKQMRVFSDYLQAYGDKYGTEFPASPADGTLPDNIKAIFITVQGQSSGEGTPMRYYWIGDNSSMRIPKELRAKTPEELNTLIVISKGLKQEGFYMGAGRAYRRTTWIIIINAQTNQVVARELFEGGSPPGSKASSGDGYGSSPDAEAISWAIEYLKSGGQTKTGSETPVATPAAQAEAVCWTNALTGFSGNRSQAWEAVIPTEVKAMLNYEQFLVEVVDNNPQLKVDGYVFNSQNTYQMPQLCGETLP